MRHYRIIAISFLLIILFAPAQIHSERERGIKIISVKNNVLVVPFKSNKELRAKTGMPLRQGDTIITKNNSYVELATPNGRVSLLPFTRLTVNNDFQPDREKYDLQMGKVYAHVSKITDKTIWAQDLPR